MRAILAQHRRNHGFLAEEFEGGSNDSVDSKDNTQEQLLVANKIAGTKSQKETPERCSPFFNNE
jgi:hypothetical protein